MSHEIEPALTWAQWDTLGDEGYGDEPTGEPLSGVGIGYANGDFPTGSLTNPFTPTQLIALLNTALPDSDLRKITRAKLQRVRQLMGAHEDDEKEFLDALASYLPPEP